jgi:hypothetical protein
MNQLDQSKRKTTLSKPFCEKRSTKVPINFDYEFLDKIKNQRYFKLTKPFAFLQDKSSNENYEIVYKNIDKLNIDVANLNHYQLLQLIQEELKVTNNHPIDATSLFNTTSNCFDHAISHFKVMTPILAEIKTQYVNTKKYYEIKRNELNYLKSKIQRKIGENSNEMFLISCKELNNIYKLKIESSLKEYEK